MQRFIRQQWLPLVFGAVIGCPFALWAIDVFIWPGMKKWQSLVGSYLTVVAALFVLLAAVIQAQNEERARRENLLNDRRSLATAVLSEVDAMITTLKSMNKSLHHRAETMKEDAAQAFQTSNEGQFWVGGDEVFKSHVSRIGILPAHLAGRVISFYGSLEHWYGIARIKAPQKLQIDTLATAITGVEFMAVILTIRLRNYLAILDTNNPMREVSFADIEASPEQTENAGVAAGYIRPTT